MGAVAVIQWLVTLGVWYCLLIDVVGNYAGQQNLVNHQNWIPIIWGTSIVLALLHGIAIGRWRHERA